MLIHRVLVRYTVHLVLADLNFFFQICFGANEDHRDGLVLKLVDTLDPATDVFEGLPDVAVIKRNLTSSIQPRLMAAFHGCR